MIGIYKITNKINGKCYIGQSVCIKKRWENHKSLNGNHDYPLYRAFKKYGLDNFKFEVLEECEKDVLSERELYYIEKYDSVKNGYNQTYSTTNPLLDEQIMDKAIKNMIANHRTDNYREKQSKITKELWDNDDYRKKVIDAINSEESLEKISETSKKMWEDEQYRSKVVMKIKKHVNTPEYKAKKSEEIKKAWARGCYNKEDYEKRFENHHQKMKNDKVYREQMIEKLKANRPNSIPVVMINKDSGEVEKEFQKLMDAAKWIRENTSYQKADYSTINKVCKGRGKTAYGYSWRYKES